MGGMGRGFSDHHVVLCKVRFVKAWIKRREVVVGAWRIRSVRRKEAAWKEVLAPIDEEAIYLFYDGLISICDPLLDTLISYHR